MIEECMSTFIRCRPTHPPIPRFDGLTRFSTRSSCLLFAGNKIQEDHWTSIIPYCNPERFVNKWKEFYRHKYHDWAFSKDGCRLNREQSWKYSLIWVPGAYADPSTYDPEKPWGCAYLASSVYFANSTEGTCLRLPNGTSLAFYLL